MTDRPGPATTRETVLVLEAQAKACLPILESCAARRRYVIAAASQRYCCGFYSRATRERVVYPSPKTEPQAAVAFLLAYLARRPVTVLFPVGEIMTDLVARHQDEFRKFTRLVLPPYETFRRGRSEILTMKAAQAAGCPIPRSWFPAEEPIEDIAVAADYPVLIKPEFGCGARGITRINSADELVRRFPQVEAEFGPALVQDFVPQTGRQYKVDIVAGGPGRVLAGVVMSKLRYYPPTGGSSVLNRTEHRPDILASAVKVVRELGWVGICDFDFITDPRDGAVKLMEINPRFPECYRATVAAGVDMTSLLYDLAMGRSPEPQLAYQPGRYLRFLMGDILWFLSTRENRWRTEPPFFDFFRPDTIYQILRANDFGPALGYLLENLSVLWDRQAREFRLRRRNR